MAVLAMCVILIVVFSVSLNGFLSFGNLFALARNISILGILALGMAVVVIGRGLDLSQVASLAAATAIAIIVMNAGYPTGLALMIGLVLAIAIGILNGFLISVVEMPPLLTTLASSLAVLGVTRSTAVQHYVVYLAKGHDDFMKLGGNIWNGVPVPILIFGAAAILLHLFSHDA
jgi:ribose transport system permease protein